MKHRTLDKLALASVIAGIGYPLLFWIILTICVSLSRSYDPLSPSISVLALGPAGWLYTVNMLILGLVITCFGVVLYLDIRAHKLSKFVLALFLIIGVSDIIGSIFQTDLPAARTLTIHAFMHQVGVGTALVMLPIAAIILWPVFRLDPDWKSFSTFTMISGTVTLGVVITRQISVITHWLDPFFGLYIRVILIFLFIWMQVISIRLLRIYRYRVKANKDQALEVGKQTYPGR